MLQLGPRSLNHPGASDMDDTSFTRGPWAVSKQKARRVTAGGIIICNAVLRNKGGPKHKTELKDEHEAEANAALIAAAPELFAACQAAEDFCAAEPGDPAYSIYRQLHLALAKARGEA